MDEINPLIAVVWPSEQHILPPTHTLGHLSAVCILAAFHRYAGVSPVQHQSECIIAPLTRAPFTFLSSLIQRQSPWPLLCYQSREENTGVFKSDMILKSSHIIQ